jgi:hypothetical protein
MGQTAHIADLVAFVAGCAVGIMSAGHLLHAWRWPLFRDGTESRYRALTGASTASFILLNTSPRLAGWNPTAVLIMTALSWGPLILSLRFLARASASRKEGEGAG